MTAQEREKEIYNLEMRYEVAKQNADYQTCFEITKLIKELENESKQST